jgi:hypothetical protein
MAVFYYTLCSTGDALSSQNEGDICCVLLKSLFSIFFSNVVCLCLHLRKTNKHVSYFFLLIKWLKGSHGFARIRWHQPL